MGNRLRVTVQLVDTKTDSHLWAEHYDREIADVSATESSIAKQVAEALGARLSSGEAVY